MASSERINVEMNQGQIDSIFHELAGVAGEAISQRVVQCAIDLNSTCANMGPNLQYSGFALQAAGNRPDRPSVRLAVGLDGKGIFTVSDTANENWGNPILTRGEHSGIGRSTQLSMRSIMSHVTDVLATASPLEPNPQLCAPEASSFMDGRMMSAATIPVLGRLLLLSREGLRYHTIGASADTATGLLGNRSGVSAYFRAHAWAEAAGTEFTFEHLHSSGEPQHVCFSCHTIINPKAHTESDILYGYDKLATKDGELYRMRFRVPTQNSRVQHEISREPVRPDDIVKLARTALDPADYLHEHWPQLAAV